MEWLIAVAVLGAAPLLGGAGLDKLGTSVRWWRWWFAPLLVGVPGAAFTTFYGLFGEDEPDLTVEFYVLLFLFFLVLCPAVLAAVGVFVRRMAKEKRQADG